MTNRAPRSSAGCSPAVFPFSALACALALAGCGGSGSNSGSDAASAPGTSADSPDTGTTVATGSGPVDTGTPPTDDTLAFSDATFAEDSATIDNRFLPLAPGTTAVLEGFGEDGEAVTVVTTVSHLKREIAGVDSAIIVDREYEDGELVEETFDWFAQDVVGNVWYLGEASTEFEDGVATSTDGSWETDVDVEGIGSVGVASVLMFAEPRVGMRYAQEIYAGVAEDRAEIIALDATVNLADGSTASALQVLESNPLEPDSVSEYKYYVAGTGLVIEEKLDDSERLVLTERLDQRTPRIDPLDFTDSTRIDHPFHPLVPGQVLRYAVDTDEGREEIQVEVLSDVRPVMGIDTVVVRDRVTLDGVVVEDTFDWFAQDDAGNVWYFGEEVTNYDYDDSGALESTNDDGSWEAGVDDAQPGVLMPAQLRIGDSFRQEYRPDKAEDLGAIVALDVPVTLADGSSYSTLQTLEWNPLEEDSFEHKYYAMGLGLVREEEVGGDVPVDLVQ